MNHTPQVSVVLPIYNAERYLVPAVASIVEQSFTDWEMICVDDGSEDATRDILSWLAAREPRIRVIRQANQGLVGALNVGCAASRAPLIARMDNDDIAFPHRLDVQVKHMQENPEVLVCGSAILEMDSDSQPLAISRLPTEHDAILANLVRRGTGHYHPSVMFRKDAAQKAGMYRKEYEWVEDHDLWIRMSKLGVLANVEEPLLCYRQHAGSVCWQRAALQRKLMNQLLSEYYAEQGLEIPHGVLLDTGVQRSKAGPGKWARCAAKGGYPRTAIKHLKELNSSPAPLGYKVRMNLETLARVGVGACKQAIRRKNPANDFQVPSYAIWEQQWLATQTTIHSTQAAA